jgi:hypothetical protein
MEKAETARLAFLQTAWAEGEASGDAGPLDGASIKEQARRKQRSSGQ